MPRTLQPCGTRAAAKRHRYHGEPLCGPCHEAEAKQSGDRYHNPESATYKRMQRATVRVSYPPRECEACGTTYAPRQGDQRICGAAECKRVITSRAFRNRPRTLADQASEARKMARRRGAVDAYIGTDDLSWRTLGLRDGWRCWICTGPVDPDHVWQFGPGRDNLQHGSLDHVVALSRGGHHTPENARLAHLGCNIARGAGEELETA